MLTAAIKITPASSVQGGLLNNVVLVECIGLVALVLLLYWIYK